jgi:CheY-like chemotaxis protein
MNATTPVNNAENGVKVMVFGNNPAEMSTFLTPLNRFEGAKFVTDFYFNLKYKYLRIQSLIPEYILIDDCYPRDQIKRFIKKIRRNVRTQEIPIAILKTRNIPLPFTGVQDYLLKDSFSPERLLYAIRNSRNIRKAQVILYKTYKRSRRQYSILMKFFKKIL